MFDKIAFNPKHEYTIPEGHWVAELSFKETKANPTKREPVAYVVPELMEVTADGPVVDRMIQDMIHEAQRGYVKEYDEGELDAAKFIVDLDELAADYFVDGRAGGGTGLKQEQLVQWLDVVLLPCLVARVKRNLSNAPSAQQNNLVAALIGQFKIAASRGNKIGNKSLTKAALEDLQKRLGTYVEDQEIDAADLEYGALIKKIGKHLAAIAAPQVDTITQQI